MTDKIMLEVHWSGGDPIKQTMELQAARAVIVQAARWSNVVGEPDAWATAETFAATLAVPWAMRVMAQHNGVLLLVDDQGAAWSIELGAILGLRASAGAQKLPVGFGLPTPPRTGQP